MKKRQTSIFSRARLRPTQVRAIADRRFDDASLLLSTRKQKHTNGAMYLAGFVIECLLKAHLLEKHPWLGSTPSPKQLTADRHEIWSLCYQSHDLDRIVARLPEVIARLDRLEQAGNTRLSRMLFGICGTWTIYARYSPHFATIEEAADFVSKVKELKQWLK